MIIDRGPIYLDTEDVGNHLSKFEAALTFVAKDRGQTEVVAMRQDEDGIQIPKHSALREHVVPQKKWRPASGRFTFAGTLKPGQDTGVADAVGILRREGGCIMVADPGSGKTVVSLALLSAIKMGNAMVLVDQVNLIEQWIQRIQTFLPAAAIKLLTGKENTRKLEKKYDLSGTEGEIIIATAQTMYRTERFSWRNPLRVGILICDEAHIFSAPSFVKAISKINFLYSVGLTATPDRKDELEIIFQMYLGKSTVHFSSETMDPIIHVLTAPSAGLDAKEWMTSFCKRFYSRTTEYKCQLCEYHNSRPDCGGDLPWSIGQNKPVWGDDLDYGGLVSAWCNSEEALAWSADLISRLMAKNRRIFYFATNVDVLVKLYEDSLAKYGDKAGLYIGKTSCPKEYRKQLDGAEHKALTFSTYKKAAKGLDVPNKDVLVLGSPTGDARQVVGRIGRVCDGKKTPLVMLPDIHIGPFMGMRRKLENFFRDKEWKIKYS